MFAQIDKSDLYKQLLNFYRSVPDAEKKLVDILQKKWVSMRVVEHFVGKYCKSHQVVVEVPEPVRGEIVTRRVDVGAIHSSWMNFYTKKLFDCCARGDRITYSTQTGINLLTTLGQLNFIRWLITYRVLEYIALHIQVIRDHMASGLVENAPRRTATPQTMAIPHMQIAAT